MLIQNCVTNRNVIQWLIDRKEYWGDGDRTRATWLSRSRAQLLYRWATPPRLLQRGYDASNYHNSKGDFPCLSDSYIWHFQNLSCKDILVLYITPLSACGEVWEEVGHFLTNPYIVILYRNAICMYKLSKNS